MKIFNFIDVRWQDGFSAVSDAPNDVRLAIEKIVETIPIASEQAHVSVQPAKLAAFPGATVGVLRFDSTVSTATRLHTYLHVLVVAGGFEPLTMAAWEALIAGRYGDDVAAQIRALNERCATADKREGKAALVPFEIELEDVAAVLEARGGDVAAAPQSGRIASPSVLAPSIEPAAAARGLRRTPAWIAAAAVVVAVIVAVQARGALGEARRALDETRSARAAAQARLAAAEAGRGAAEGRVAGIAEEVERLKGKCVFADQNAEDVAVRLQRCEQEVAQVRDRAGACDATLADHRAALEQYKVQVTGHVRDAAGLRTAAAGTDRKLQELRVAHDELARQKAAEAAARKIAVDEGKRLRTRLDTVLRANAAGIEKSARLTHALLNVCGKCGTACQAICRGAAQ